MAAAVLCRAIVEHGPAEPPWRPRPAPPLPLARVFVDPLSAAEARVMLHGYAMARDLLSRHAESLVLLMTLLVDRPVVRGEELRAVLGPRPVASTALWRALSGEVRAEFTVR